MFLLCLLAADSLRGGSEMSIAGLGKIGPVADVRLLSPEYCPSTSVAFETDESITYFLVVKPIEDSLSYQPGMDELN